MDVEVSHLTLKEEQFKLKDNQSFIIFGPNGVGKSSLYRSLQEQNNEEYDFLDYEEMKINYVPKKGTKIDVNPHSTKIVRLNDELEKILKRLDIKDNLKSLGITNQTRAKEISKKFLELQKKKYYDMKINLSKNMFQDILNFKKNENILDSDILFAISNYEELTNVEALKKEIEKYEKTYLDEVLKLLSHNLSETDIICPVCNSSVNNLKEIIERKVEESYVIKNKIILQYEQDNSELDRLAIADKLNKITELVELCSERDLSEFLFLDSNYSNKEYLNTNIEKLQNIKNQINVAENKVIRSYNNLKKNEERYTSYIQDEFKVNVNFNDEDYSVNIQLKRAPAKYSTGEFNVILFCTKIFEFIGGEKRYLILDDPLSSFDMVNQYRIVFDLVSSKAPDKNFIIFTHNLNMINLTNTQHCNLFQYKILENINGVLHLLDLGFNGRNSLHNIENILHHSDFEHFNAYVKVVMERENKKNPDHNAMNKIYHYDQGPSTYNFKSIVLSNVELVNLIELLDEDQIKNKTSYLSKLEYSAITIIKITYMLALRVWIEKKMYDAVEDKKKYASMITLGSKINYVFSSSEATSNIKKLYPKLTREELMSKAVMLNQHSHFESQGIPFFYIYNLTLDSILEEIKEVKRLFELSK